MITPVNRNQESAVIRSVETLASMVENRSERVIIRFESSEQIPVNRHHQSADWWRMGKARGGMGSDPGMERQEGFPSLVSILR